MKIEYDEAKNQRNIETRGISFDLAYEFELELAFIKPDLRFDYQELRFIAIGYIQQRLYVLVFTPKHNEIMRVISLRKANKREVNLYEKYIKNRS